MNNNNNKLKLPHRKCALWNWRQNSFSCRRTPSWVGLLRRVVPRWRPQGLGQEERRGTRCGGSESGCGVLESKKRKTEPGLNTATQAPDLASLWRAVSPDEEQLRFVRCRYVRGSERGQLPGIERGEGKERRWSEQDGRKGRNVCCVWWLVAGVGVRAPLARQTATGDRSPPRRIGPSRAQTRAIAPRLDAPSLSPRPRAKSTRPA